MQAICEKNTGVYTAAGALRTPAEVVSALPGLKASFGSGALWLFQARRADRPYAGGDNHR
jgi:hypothetical protein